MPIDVWCVHYVFPIWHHWKDEILKPHVQAFRSKTVNDVSYSKKLLTSTKTTRKKKKIFFYIEKSKKITHRVWCKTDRKCHRIDIFYVGFGNPHPPSISSSMFDPENKRIKGFVIRRNDELTWETKIGNEIRWFFSIIIWLRVLGTGIYLMMYRNAEKFIY
jgi:hypothetical protein